MNRKGNEEDHETSSLHLLCGKVVSRSWSDGPGYGNGWPVGPKTQLLLLALFTNISKGRTFSGHKDGWYDEPPQLAEFRL